MRHLTDQMIADAINQLPDTFDCHGIEKRCLRDHAIATAHELVAQAGSGDPLRYFSAVFAKYVDAAFRGQLQKLSKVESQNLGGEISKNQTWQKLVATIVPPASPPDLDNVLRELNAGPEERQTGPNL